MKIKTASFEVSAPDLKACPPSVLPEFALIGRSNVGKSSLINMLVERRDLAKVSITPGKTKLINFFKINGTWTLVDLPGYGYAKLAKDKRCDFNDSVANYIEKRDNLRGVFVLIDSTLPPQKIDLEFLRWLGDTGRPFALILTKIDRQSATATRACMALFEEALRDIFGEIPTRIVCSSKTKDGRRELLALIEQAMSANKTPGPGSAFPS
ncbi:MAG: ribosome biogenesis GTP-binding protein YihA/YsxC [Opitutaceae bacterium]|jgi:GTP-binding protein